MSFSNSVAEPIIDGVNDDISLKESIFSDMCDEMHSVIVENEMLHNCEVSRCEIINGKKYNIKVVVSVSQEESITQ